jgi:hypothetical protein
MNTLAQGLETALQLPYEQQEIPIKILQNRHHENRRAEMAADAKKNPGGLPCRKISTPVSRGCRSSIAPVFAGARSMRSRVLTPKFKRAFPKEIDTPTPKGDGILKKFRSWDSFSLK